MSCDDALKALAALSSCEDTLDGSRLQTHCLYPSFDSVYVYVAKVGDGFRVSDNAEAFSAAWLHGRDDVAIGRAIDAECRRHHLLRGSDNSIVANAVNADWLPNAIITVANAAGNAATAAVAKIAAATEEALSIRISRSLETTFGAKAVGHDYEVKGNSGGIRRFDFVVRGSKEAELLINGVSAHHSSVSSKYVSFADTATSRDFKLAVFDRRLPSDDASLLAQVATTLPIESLAVGAERAFAHAI